MAARQDLIVTLSGERPPSEVAKDLAAAGFAVRDVLDAIGVITGSAAASRIERLGKIAGVADVSEDHPVSIAPQG